MSPDTAFLLGLALTTITAFLCLFYLRGPLQLLTKRLTAER